MTKKIIYSFFNVLYRTIEVLLAFLIVGGGLFFWRLYSSPLEIKAYMPTLEQYILPKDAGLKLEAQSVELGAAFRDEGILHISIQNLKIVRKDGRTVLRLPEVNISYDLWSLLILDYTPDTVTIRNAFLRLTIDETGKPYLYGDTKEIADDQTKLDETGVILDEKKSPNLEKIIKHILSFDTVALDNARVRIIDRQKNQRISLPSVNLALERQPEMKHALKANIAIKIQQQLTHLNLEAQISRLTKKMSFDFEFDTLNLKELSRFIPALQDADLNVEAHLKGMADFNRNCSNIISCFKEGSFRLKTTRPGTLNLPDPLTNLYHVESATINGAISSDLNQIKIAKSVVQLENGPTATLDVNIDGIGEFLNTNNLQAINVTLKSDLSSLPIEQVPDVWPVATGPDAHAWVKENLSKGMVEKATFTLYFKGDELTDLYGEMPVKDIQVRYLDEMTPVGGFNGVVKLWPDRVLITGQDGTINHLKLTEAEIDLTDLQADISHAKINLSVQGPVKEAMELIAEKPLEFPQIFGLEPQKTDGQAITKVSLAFPLIDDLDTTQVIANVEAYITDGVFPTPIGGENLTNGILNLSVDNQKLTVQGTGNLLNIPLKIKWDESLIAEKENDIQSSYDIQAAVHSEKLKSLFPQVEDYILGSADVKAEITSTVSKVMNIALTADLKNARLKLYPISIEKPIGEKTLLATKINISNEKSGSFEIDMDGSLNDKKDEKFEVTATGEWAQHLQVRLNKILAPNNDFKGSFYWDGKEKIDIELTGQAWDLSDIYNIPKTTESIPSSAESLTPWFSDISLSINLTKITLEKEKPLSNVMINGLKKNNLWKALKINATGEKTFNLTFTPKKQLLAAKTENIGDLIRRLGISKDIVNGNFKMDAYQQKAGGFDGSIKMADFSLKDPGFLVQAFSILGIVDAITGDDLKFSTAVIPFKIRSSPTLSVALEDAYMSGTSLGITFIGKISLDKLALNGSVIPAYAINSLPGKIPVIGALFKDSDGGGLIGAKYEINGSPAHPEISFKPLSSIAPGILGKLFQ